MPKGKNKKVIGLMKDELGRKIMKTFVELWAKTCSYLIDMIVKIKKQRSQKSVSLKENLNLKIKKTV